MWCNATIVRNSKNYSSFKLFIDLLLFHLLFSNSFIKEKTLLSLAEHLLLLGVLIIHFNTSINLSFHIFHQFLSLSLSNSIWQRKVDKALPVPDLGGNSRVAILFVLDWKRPSEGRRDARWWWGWRGVGVLLGLGERWWDWGRGQAELCMHRCDLAIVRWNETWRRRRSDVVCWLRL